MRAPEDTSGASVSQPETDVDILIVGAGIVGIYELYRAREAGYSVRLLEQGSGVGGTWFWNRYPGARFDSESYTYAYLFSSDLFAEWDWKEHFAPQTETERYLNYTIDKFDLRRHLRFAAKVTSAVYEEQAGTWVVQAADGSQHRARYVIAATGVLSVPFFPNVPGREDFRGESHHTGRWPAQPLDFRGKRVAVIGTGASGVQIIPIIADQVASLTVYQRTPNWCTPLNNRPIEPAEQAALKAGFQRLRQTLSESMSGFLHVPHNRKTFDDSKEERWAFFEKIWNSPGFSKMTTNYNDMMTDPAANAEWCEFIEQKIRGIVTDPATVEKLIPDDHGYGGKRPPFVTGYYEAYNNPKVSIVDLRETPMTQVTETGIETSEGVREFDIIAWATGFDFGTGALNRMGVRGRDGLALEEYWADGPSTFLGIMCHGFPNFFFPGGPHGAAGNNPRYAEDQSNFIAGALEYAREHGYSVIEVPAAKEQEWTDMVNGSGTSFNETSYFFGANVPGKPVRLLLNPRGRPKLLEEMAVVIDSEYKGFLS
jgi:cation diffusion facilitator CzcD-associated flavoprotein CzcO